jgi:hypothetical protein
MDDLYPPVGAGRIRREAHHVFVGDTQFDVDDLRSHHVAVMLKPAMEKLTPPPTAEECLWIIRYFDHRDYRKNQVADMLMEVLVRARRTIPP